MKGIKVYISEPSWICIENDFSLEHFESSTSNCKQQKVVSEWFAFPTFSVLIEHPEIGMDPFTILAHILMS